VPISLLFHCTKESGANLLSKFLFQVALPILNHLLAHCWDPQSSDRTARTAAAVSEILIYVPPESEAVREMLSAVQAKIADVVEKLVVPAWTPALLAAAPQV
jgi:hypothetical protein